MLSPKHQRYADRIRDLIAEGQDVAKLEPTTGSISSRFIKGEDKIRLHAWLVKTRNMLQALFGPESPHASQFGEVLPREGVRNVSKSHEVYSIVGVLEGALRDLEDGFLVGQEFIIAAEVFDTILEQAQELNDKGYKDPAAVLCRVALEDALKRMARAEGIDDTLKATIINQKLWKAGVYSKATWRHVDGWLAIGNFAAHGEFGKYSQEDVERLIEDAERFIALEFRT